MKRLGVIPNFFGKYWIREVLGNGRKWLGKKWDKG